MDIPTIEDVKSAAERLQEQAVVTPLLQSRALNAVTGAQVYIKPECLQRTGSFKFRGAFNAISRLDDAVRARGVSASSSGNHAQGVAAAAEIFGIPATIVMPEDAPALKVRRTRNSGAEVIFYDRGSADREQVVNKVVEENGTTYIHPFNNFHVIAGQGTVGLEISQSMQALGRQPDRVLICTGGGGLTAGVALAINHSFPDAKIHTVEPEGFDDYRRSLLSGVPVRNPTQAGSICDAILTPSPGPIGFEINKNLISEGLVISDEEAMDAVRYAYEELKLVAEPGGAAALAALLKAEKTWAGETIAIVISGGNIDPSTFADIVNR